MCSECLPERTCDFEPLEYEPRTSARAQTCVRGPCGLPARHRGGRTKKDPRAEEKKMSKGQTYRFIYTQGSGGAAYRRPRPPQKIRKEEVEKGKLMVGTKRLRCTA